MSTKKRSSKAAVEEVSDNEKENAQNLSPESGSASKKRAANDSPAPTRPKKSQKKSKGDTPGQGAQAEEEQEKKGKKRRRSEPGSPKKTKKKRKSDGDGSDLAEENVKLFEIMKSRNAALTITIDEWLKTYEEEKEDAMFSLVNFIVQSCGSTATIARDEFDTFEPNDDIKAILRRLTEETGLEAEGGEYPIVSRKQALKKFKANFMEFWKKLIGQCSKTVLYDGYFLPQLVGWVNAISENDIRTFRHTATVIGLQIVRSLCTVGASLRNQLETNDRLLKAENKKKDAEKSKVTSLTKKSQQLNKNIATIEEHINDLFEHIFAHRYRDIFPDIRSACIEALGQWMMEYPAFFLTDNHLRYFGWLISDKVGEVRITALKSMQKLYAKEDIRVQLDNFTQYFKTRIIQTIEDKVAAIDSITLNGQLAEADLLDEDDINRIYALISDENAPIRFAAGEFIYQHLLNKSNADPSNPDHDAQLRAFLDFIEEKTQHAELPNYIVDALWGKAAVLKDWAAMTNLLLTESQKKALSDSQQTLLVRILNCSVKKACGEKIVPKTKTDPDHKDKKETIQENKSKLSEHLVKALPQVLQRFKADKEKTADLVEIPQYFDLGVYSTFRLTTQHKELLKLLQEIFNKSVDETTFRNIAKTLSYFQQENENARQTDVAINELSDTAFAKFRSALDNGESEESEEELALTLALQRLAELTKYLGLAHLDDLFDSVDNALRGNLAAHGDEPVVRAFDILFYQLAWARSKIDPNRPDADAIDTLVRRRDAVFRLLEKYLTNKSVAIAEKAFLVANDMLILFSKNMREAKTSLSSLAYSPSVALVTKIRGFFDDEVTNKQTFRDDEDEMARKEKLITALAKSIAFNAFNVEHAPAVLCNFVSHGKFIEEIVKTFLHKLREKYKDNEYRFVLETLKIKYEQIESSITEGEAVTVPTSPQKKKKSKAKKTDDEEEQEKDKEEEDDLEEDDEDHATRTPLRALERLSKRLADTYGIPTQRHEWLRRSLYQVVKSCVYYAIEDFPARVNFFRAALFFLSKLDAQSARILRDDFNRKTADLEYDEYDHSLRPFLSFKEKLERLASGEKGSPAKKKAAAPKKQTENVRKKLEFTKAKQSKDSEEDENNEEEEALEDKRKTKSKGKGKKQAAEEEEEPEETTSSKKKGAKGKGKGKKQAASDEEEEAEEEPQQKKGKKGTNTSRVQSIYSEEEPEKSDDEDLENSMDEDQIREKLFGTKKK